MKKENIAIVISIVCLVISIYAVYMSLEQGKKIEENLQKTEQINDQTMNLLENANQTIQYLKDGNWINTVILNILENRTGT